MVHFAVSMLMCFFNCSPQGKCVTKMQKCSGMIMFFESNVSLAQTQGKASFSDKTCMADHCCTDTVGSKSLRPHCKSGILLQ